ncbi:type II/IV secretion system protein [Candidatus Peregrinibacteria bacterium]|nr:type II/IV secretion system protein [Candidatus Peregrinibacteria bacterium]
MPDVQSKLIDFLLQGQFLTEVQIKEIEAEATKLNQPFEMVLLEKDFMKDADLGQIIADVHGWSFVNLRREAIEEATLRLLPESFARERRAVIFSHTETETKVATANPEDASLHELLKAKIGEGSLSFYFATPRDIAESLYRYQEQIEEKFHALIAAHSKEAIFGKASDSAVVQLVDLLLSHGYKTKASDIHIEPQSHDTLVRFRIDGILHDIVRIPAEIHDLVITRIKILSKLRTDEHQVPQDGKIEFNFDDSPVDIRISIVPTSRGENVVMRLLSEKTRQLTLEDLGFLEHDFTKLRAAIKRPWGMILVTGPTGSGKTTSLYAILKILNTRSVNIATIEDPVEYSIDGITQIQVNTKANLTFATGLRALVRQDPNVIMVGEIRDHETAEIAVNSAMTGHLVLSTLHTNDAPTALPRLLDMGIEPFLTASTVNIVIAQRLVRRICQRCISTYEASSDILKDRLPPFILEKLSRGQSIVTLYKGQGCNLCKNTGYIGRVGVFEALEISDSIRHLIMQNSDADTIKKKAVEEGMMTMLDDALEKVLDGMTTVEEMIRVVKN